ncbi:DsbC family protein [Xanthomonas perforans]|uniref:Thiol:disulfide interchange protein n=6 Tax=Xanthomonas TaxID=338 RepID=A0A1L5QZJ9_XANPE|nr:MULTISPECIES: DsbC family protein [Xanthomonas]MEB1846206.1 DsbC family protein [Xanthomonas campestris pv. campestris]APO97785.1 hypothetical protein BJD13_00940 [Xanthomonas perforans]APP78141.1 hypothetical protein BJD12_22670 [Xanthomonas vesicatoria ATCC 35937]APP82612.1 hypothetical protein BJD10_23285 [Xanthomonas hortorum pv. gardneri]APP87326.1 hypothetical protein BI317_25020 [Xanthomonas hortorum pv. gardneri]
MKFITMTALAVGLAAALSFTAASASEATIRDAVKLINPKAEVKSISDFGMPGVKQVVADTSVVYISDDGRFVFSGLMLDMVEKRNLSEEAQSLSRQALLSTIPKNAVISYEPKDVKHRITVFTDVSCGYCQMLHKNMQSYLDKGIAVDYVPFPRGGLESPVFATMQSAWCAKDQKKALDAAYQGATPPEVKCADSVAAMYQLGDKLGVDGTPAIYDQYGNHMGGYVPADQLVQQLDTHNTRKTGLKTAAK